MNRAKRPALTILVAGLFLALAGHLFTGSLRAAQKAQAASFPKYVFIFLADGAGIAHLELARLYNRHVHREGLTITDRIMREGSVGLLTTHAADLLVTDSAAAATALASGCKATSTAVGICADGKAPKTVLEAAKDKGMKIGLVTNSTIYDASPAAFAAHVPDRNQHATIVEQYLGLEPDLLLGGGRDQFLPQGRPGSARKDSREVVALFKSRGYEVVTDKQGLARAATGRILGLFSLKEMSFELDRDKRTEPSVYDMTEAAVRTLEGNAPGGFTLFIETENTDSAAHLKDAASVIHDLREFDRAVGLAYDFYKKHPAETLILVTSDHEAGGLNLTRGGSLKDLERIASITMSISKAVELLSQNPTADTVDRLLAEHFRGFVAGADLKKAMLQTKTLGLAFDSRSAAAALAELVAKNTHISWVSGHTNQPVFVAALGAGAERFAGYQDNTDFGKHLMALIQKSETTPKH